MPMLAIGRSIYIYVLYILLRMFCTKKTGRCCGDSRASEYGGVADVDDVSFLKSMIEKLVADNDKNTQYKVDPTRIYMTGHSNGCAMAQRFTAEHSELIAAVGCHSFYLLSDVPDTYLPRPMIEVHGDKDDSVPYDFRPEGDEKDFWTTGADYNLNRM